jgi:FkbM family methyltransferase
MDLSYAQHLEDYHLNLAFGDQKTGFYIDVGAGHPVADNVSCWFYLRGWGGIVVEPQAELTELYAHVRPRDIRETCVLGRARGEIDFYAVDRLHGLSTIKPEVVAKAKDIGAKSYKTVKMRMETLASLCEKHGVRTIDFLKVDVEGAEGDVLAGNDWKRFRPRVVMCEAMAPGLAPGHWVAWEQELLAQDYEFVLFEDLNRFPRQKAEWLVVPHLGHTNRAPFREDHPDHAFAKELVGAFFARLPKLDRGLLLDLLLAGEPGDLSARPSAEDRARVRARLFPTGKFAEAGDGVEAIDAPTLRELYVKIMDSDPFRIMMGRLAMSWDGGQILD